MNERSAATELAAELRTILRLLNEREHTSEQFDAALAHAGELRRALGGPRRARWYQTDREQYGVHSMFRGRDNPVAPPMVCAIVALPDGQRVVEGRVTVPLLYEGPPGGVHGGYVAGLFDDILGGAQQLIEGGSGLTGTLTVRYRALTPVDTELRFRAWIERSSGRRIVGKATCHAGDVLTADADILFIRVDMQRLAARAAGDDC